MTRTRVAAAALLGAALAIALAWSSSPTADLEPQVRGATPPPTPRPAPSATPSRAYEHQSVVEEVVGAMARQLDQGLIRCPLPPGLDLDLDTARIEGVDLAPSARDDELLGRVRETSGEAWVLVRGNGSPPYTWTYFDDSSWQGWIRWSGADPGREGTCVVEPAEVVEVIVHVEGPGDPEDHAWVRIRCQGGCEVTEAERSVTVVQALREATIQLDATSTYLPDRAAELYIPRRGPPPEVAFGTIEITWVRTLRAFVGRKAEDWARDTMRAPDLPPPMPAGYRALDDPTLSPEARAFLEESRAKWRAYASGEL